MTRKRIGNILLKEWVLMFSDLNGALIVTLLPLLVVGQGILYIWLVINFGGDAVLNSSVFQTALEKLGNALPAIKGLAEGEKLEVLLLNQFSFFLLLIPTMIAVSFATFSIVEEKLSGSLEPLLATPVRTWELLSGKAISGAVPALIMTWVCAVIYLAAVAAIGWGHLIHLVLTPSWYISLFLLTPAVAILSFLLGVIGSSRAGDAKSAQNFVVLIILPVFALIAVQVTGIVWFNTLFTLLLSVAVALLDVIILRIAIRLFQRELIVVRWR